jgi:hypothetical protein
MGFTADDRVLIRILRIEKGYGAKKFIKEFPTRNWSLASVKRLLKKIDNTGSADRKKGSGKQRSKRTVLNIAMVDEMILSQEGQPGTHRTVRQITAETEYEKYEKEK